MMAIPGNRQLLPFGHDLPETPWNPRGNRRKEYAQSSSIIQQQISLNVHSVMSHTYVFQPLHILHTRPVSFPTLFHHVDHCFLQSTLFPSVHPRVRCRKTAPPPRLPTCPSLSVAVITHPSSHCLSWQPVETQPVEAPSVVAARRDAVCRDAVSRGSLS